MIAIFGVIFLAGSEYTLALHHTNDRTTDHHRHHNHHYDRYYNSSALSSKRGSSQVADFVPSKNNLNLIAAAQPQPQQQQPSSTIGWSPRVGTMKLVRLDAPSQVIEGHPIKLRCIYESRGDRLQSLSWSRNGREFYRYQPFERTIQSQHLFFNSTGIHPDIHKSRNNTVILTNTSVETSGRYRCEVTGSQFQEVKMETYVNVTAASNGSGPLHTPHYWLSNHIYISLALSFIQIRRFYYQFH